MTSLLRRFSLLPIMAFVAIAYIVLHFFCANVFAQQSPLRLATTATLQPRWTALASQTVYLLTTTATQARGQNVMGILAATNKGLHQSLDTGQTWSSLGLPNDDVYDAVLLNGAIIAATDKGIQMRASSGAVSWQARTYPVSTGNATQATIQQRGLPTYTLHSVGTSIYAGTTRGVYRSTDGGATWTTTGTVLASKTVRTVISLGSTLFAAVWNDGVYRSQDNGITWSLVDIVPGSTVERTFRSLSVYGSVIYAGSSEGNLYQSDNGTSWRRVVSTGNNGQNGVNARGIEALSRYGNTIIGAVYNGIAYSHDNGQTWKLMQVASRDIGTIVILPPKPVVKGPRQVAAIWEKGAASLQSDDPCGPTAVSCGGGTGGVAVGGGSGSGSGSGSGTGSGSGVSGYNLSGCNPIAPTITLTPSSAVQQSTPLSLTFSIGVSATLTEFRLEMASPNNPNAWIDLTTSWSQAAGNTITGMASIVAGFMQTPGTYRIRAWGVREDGFCVGSYTSDPQSFIIIPADPILNTITVSPQGAYTGQNTTLTLGGSNFFTNPQASVAFFNAQAQPVSFPFTLTGITPNTITAQFYAPPSGVYYAEVRNTVNGTTYTSGRVPFTIAVPPAPILSSITLPNNAARLVAGANGSITLNGANFFTTALDGTSGGALVSVNGQANAWTVTSRTASALTVQLPASLAEGTYTLTVVNPDGQQSGTAQVLVVPPLAVVSLAPEILLVEQAATISLGGTFRAGVTHVDAANINGQPSVSNSAISFGVNIPGANPPSHYSITLSEPTTFGQTALTRTIPVQFPLPVLNSLSPIEIDATTTENGAPQIVTLTGEGFTSRTGVFAGLRDLSSFITSRTATSLTLTFPAGTFSTPEIVQVRTENPGNRVSGTQTLTIRNVAPIASALSPQTLTAGIGGSLTITGSKFFSNTVTQVLVGEGASAVQVQGITVTPTSITAPIPAVMVPDIGTLRVVVRNVFGTDTKESAPQTVRIVHPVPTISGVAPATIPAFESSTTLTLTGTNVAAGNASSVPPIPTRLRVTFERNNVITPLTLLANPTATQVRVSVPASLLTDLGTATIRLQNTDASATETMPPGGPSATTTITVVPPRPTLTSVSPNTATAGTGAQPVTITGAKFIQQGLRIVIRNAQSGLSRDLNAVTFSSNTSVGGTIPADIIQMAGSYTLEVVNAADAQGLGGGVSTSTLPFTIVNPAPTISSLAPNPATVYETFTLDVQGTGFVSGATSVVVDGQTFSGSAVNVLSPTRLTVNVAAVNTAKSASVSVTNPPVNNPVGIPTGGGTATATVPIVPPLPTVSQAQGNQGGGTLTRNLAGTLTVTGTGFVPGAVVNFNGQDLTTTFGSQNSLSANVPASLLNIVGSFPVTVRNPQFQSLGGGISTPAVNVTVQNPAAVLTSINPVSVTRGADLVLTLTGSSFYDGALVFINNTTFTPNSISANSISLTIPAANLPSAGAYSVVVRNSEPTLGASAPHTLTVNNPAPVLTALTQNQADAFSDNLTLTVSGNGFEQGITAYWKPQSGSRQALPAPTSVSANSVTITIPTALMTVAGAFGISLENAAPSLGASNSLGFTVLDRVPTLTGITPNPIEALSAATQITISGDYFSPTAEALWNGQPLARVSVSRTSLVVTVPQNRLTLATLAQITVRNPQFNTGSSLLGGGVSLPQELTVINPLPTLTNITPDMVNAGTTRAIITLDGTKFMPSSSIEIGSGTSTNGTSWVSVTAVYVSPTRLSFTLSSSALVEPALLMLRVSSPKITNQAGMTLGGGISSELPFIIRPADPTLSRITPTVATLTVTSPSVEITLTGTGFTPASVVRIAGQTTTGTLYISPTQLRFTLSRPAGIYGLSVVNEPVLLNGTPQGGGVSGTINISVLNPQPVLMSLSPATTAASLSSWTLTLRGENFTPTSRVNYNGTLLSTANVDFISTTELRALLPAPPIAATTHSVRVENPLVSGQGGGSSVWLPLAIIFPQPRITSLSDNSTNATLSDWTIQIRGQLFASGAIVSLNGTPIDASVVNSTTIRAIIPAASTRSAAVYTLRVSNPTPGGGYAEAAFAVANPAPSLTSISPLAVTAGASTLFTLTGTNFVTNSTVLVDGAAIQPTTFAAASVLSSTALTVSVPAGFLATSGSYTMRVINPAPGGGQSGTRSFTVYAAQVATAEFIGVTTAVLAGSADGFAVRFRDSFGNLTDFPATVVNFTNESGSSTGTIALRRTSLGTSSATATTYTIDGNYRLWIEGISTTTGNASFVVNANSDASVEIVGVQERLQAGEMLPPFTVRYFDRFGNPTDRNIGDVTLRYSTAGTVRHTLAITRLSEGVYHTQPYQLTLADRYFVQISGMSHINTRYTASTGTVVLGALPFADVTPTTAVRATLTGVDIDITANQTQTNARVRTYDEYGNLTNVPTITTLNFSNATDATMGIRSSTGTMSLTRTGFGVYDVDGTRLWFAGAYTLTAPELATTTGGRFFEVRALAATNVAFQPSTTSVAKGDENAVLTITYRDKFGNATNLATFPADVEYAGMTMTSSGTLSLGVVPTLPGTVRTKLSSLSKLGDYRVQIAGLTLPVVGTQRFEIIGREAASAEISGLPASLGCNSTDDIDIVLNVRDSRNETTNNYPSGIRFVVTRNGIEIERGTLSFIRELSEGTLLYRLRAPFTHGIYTLSVISTSLAPEDVTGTLVMDVCPNLVPSIVLSPTSLFFTAISLSGSVVQTYTVQYQNTNSVTITLPPGFFVRVQNFGAYQSGTVTLPTPGGSGTLTLQLLYEPTALGVVNVNIPHSGVGTSLTTPTRNLNVVASVVACPVVRDTVSILPVFSQTARQNLIDDGRNISRYLTDTYRISSPVFRNSGINNVMIRFTHPEGVLVGNNDLFMSNAQVVNARTQARADVVAFYNHNGDYYAQYIGSGRDFDFSYFYVDSRGNPLTYITMHEVGHVLYGAHELSVRELYPETNPNHNSWINDRYADGRGINPWVHRISNTNVWSAYIYGTILYHGRGVTPIPPTAERVPFFSNPNISIEVRADADPTGTIVQMNGRRTLVMGDGATANMARVISIEGPIVANQFPTLLSIAILGSPVLARGASAQYTVQTCSNRDLRYEWSIRPVETIPSVQFQLVGTNAAFNLTMLSNWDGLILRVRVFDAASGVELGSDEIFIQCGSCNDIPIALQSAPQNGASLSAVNPEASAGQAPKGDEEAPLIQGLVLEPNYPNPFSQETEIAFTLPATTPVRLLLHDALGREVAMLLNGETYSRGRHTLKFNGTKLPSGVYSLHLQAGIWKTSRTITLIR